MSLTTTELKKISDLAYIEINEINCEHLTNEVNQIMDFIEQLRTVNTANISPLPHPAASFQRLRDDEVKEKNLVLELEAIAPQFEEGFYLVPQVIEEGK